MKKLFLSLLLLLPVCIAAKTSVISQSFWEATDTFLLQTG